MVDERILARNWVAWCGLAGAAAGMGVSEERIKELLEAPCNESGAEEKKSRPRYTAEQKAEALRLLSQIGPLKTSQQTGISIASLMKWRQEASLATEAAIINV